jgi:Ras-related protein Rab-8A
MQDRSVSTEEGRALADEYEIQFFETSAKQDFRVEDAFLAIATDVKDRLMADGAAGSGSTTGHKLSSNGAQAPAKSGCC